MKFTKISIDNKFFNDVCKLYVAAFPVDERRELSDLRRFVVEREEFSVEACLTDEGRFAGFFTSWQWPDFRYGEHFAVLAEKRSCGVGGEILDRMLRCDTRPMVIEVEPPVDEMASRRIGFYERHGLTLRTDIDYLQPPYDSSRKPLPLRLMTYGEMTHERLTAAVKTIHKNVYGVEE